MPLFETPILFIIYNRPDTTSQVFESIRQIKPKYLYIAADGPRKYKPGDPERCKKARDIISKVDWACEVKTLFRDKNLGCGKGVSGAITWFFDNVEEGIILEDDCVPNMEFFRFCKDMLSRYKLNPAIVSVAGSNFQNGLKRGDASYYFSTHNRIWGWATWKRTWEQYDFFLNNIEEKDFLQILKSLFKLKKEREYWLDVFKCTKDGQIDTWDFQFMFLLWKLRGLTVTPNVNLVSNIGDGDEATHTTWGKDNLNLYIQTCNIYPINHPATIQRNRKADEYYFLKFINPKSSIGDRLRRKIKKFLIRLK